ncbi:MAG: isoleucine--tRNA ligase, partial [Magnetococcales bacterium]|nr:isoleucine--tRNA ligase [Magnetococcales bacterium]
ITVKFPLAANESLADVDPALVGHKVAVAIWTTTPWTLPANLAVCLNPQFTYVAVKLEDNSHCPNWQLDELIILAEGLWESAVKAMGADPESCQIVTQFTGRSLDRKKFRHPWLDQDAMIVLAGHVTLEAGTGCVHTAPGHGQEDYVVGQQYRLPVFNPVNDRGIFLPETPHVAGLFVRKADPVVVALLQEKGMLLGKSSLLHSYPHCWRCHNPIITRATPQWFISMETNQLRQRALQAIRQTRWVPAYGVDRIGNMVANRPDWCVSRQRNWGVPIAVISCGDCGQILSDSQAVEKVALRMEEGGADVWFTDDAASFLPEGFRCPKCGSDHFRKEKDILDVWFDSGVTHAAVLERRSELGWPADLYLEGSDQHRGWFHSSLLAAIGSGRSAPYRAVLTHGFVVDGKGRKMSKSLGNVVAPEKVIQQYGVDILRMWASAEDYTGDIRISDEILKGLSEAYRRIRNTMRFLLGNLDGFDPAREQVSFQQMPELDRWALNRLSTLINKVQEAYEEFAFHRVYQELHYFCSVDLGAFYLDVLKDRLYCDDPASQGRMAARCSLNHILESLVRLMAPIFSFTAEEIWDYMAGEREKSVHLAQFPQPHPEWQQDGLEERWNRFRQIRGEAYRLLEIERQEKRLGTFMQAVVEYYADDELKAFLNSFDQPERLLIVSRAVVMDLDQAPEDAVTATEVSGLKIRTLLAQGEKCQRCWNWDSQVGQFADHPQLCGRCRQVIVGS